MPTNHYALLMFVIGYDNTVVEPA